MDQTLDTEPPATAPQAEPPRTATPGRQPTEAAAQAPTGDAQPRAGASPQDFVEAMSALMLALSKVKESIFECYEPYAAGFAAYERVLAQRTERQQMATQVAFQIFFVGVGGAFGGMLQQFIRNRLPGSLNAARVAPAAPAPAAPPPANAVTRREFLGGTAPPARPAAPPAPAAAPRGITRDSMPVAAAGTTAGDLLKDFIKSFNPHGDGGPLVLGESGPFRPEIVLNRLNLGVQSVETRGWSVLRALQAAARSNEQLDTDPLGAMQEIIAQLQMPPQGRDAAYYTRELLSHDVTFRSVRERVMTAESLGGLDELLFTNRQFLRDIEQVCPGFVTPMLEEARARLVARQRTLPGIVRSPSRNL